MWVECVFEWVTELVIECVCGGSSESVFVILCYIVYGVFRIFSH